MRSQRVCDMKRQRQTSLVGFVKRTKGTEDQVAIDDLVSVDDQSLDCANTSGVDADDSDSNQPETSPAITSVGKSDNGTATYYDISTLVNQSHQPDEIRLKLIDLRVP